MEITSEEVKHHYVVALRMQKLVNPLCVRRMAVSIRARSPLRLR